jgi:hypothetical protein
LNRKETRGFQSHSFRYEIVEKNCKLQSLGTQNKLRYLEDVDKFNKNRNKLKKYVHKMSRFIFI